MPDSIQHILPTPIVEAPAQLDNVDLSASDRYLLHQALKANTTPTPQTAKPAQKSAATTAPAATPTLSADTTAVSTDSLQTLSATHISKREMIHTSKGESAPAAATMHQAAGISESDWILSGVLVVLLLIAFRLRRNSKFLKTLVHESVDVRPRGNMFTDTMRETTFTLLLIALSICSMGLLLAQGVHLWHTGAEMPAGEFPAGTPLCIAIVGGYYICQRIAYFFIGNTFGSHTQRRMWLQGFRAISALPGMILLPLALIATFYPQSLNIVLILSVLVYFAARIIFIFKGFRIFSTPGSNYLLFLYYLCSVEIVPLILIWQAACRFA